MSQFYSHSHFSAFLVLGMTLIFGLIAGELAKRSYFLPKISGYLLVGFLIGPEAFNIVTSSLLSSARIFVDISLGLILFSLGRHLDLRWLRRDRGILYMSAAESFLTFVTIFCLLILFKFSWLPAALAGAIAISTSPAVVMLVASDLRSEGPVTRRTLILTSLNNLFALLLFSILLPFTYESSQKIADIAYRITGSIFLGLIIFFITLITARLIGKQRENQFILLVGSIISAIGVAKILALSTMLSLFTLGFAARNLNYKYYLMEINFDLIAKLFFIVLFVFTGVYLQIGMLSTVGMMVVVFIIARLAAKSTGIMFFSTYSNLTKQQARALCLALTPMAGLAMGMSNTILDFNPNLGYKLMSVIAGAVVILTILSPIAVQLAFISSDEAASREEDN